MTQNIDRRERSRKTAVQQFQESSREIKEETLMKAHKGRAKRKNSKVNSDKKMERKWKGNRAY